MATFLQLCQRVHRYARIGQDPPGTAPVSVADQEDVLAEIVGWVQDANEDIQLDQDAWRFRETPGAVAVTAGQRDVDLAALILAQDYDELRPYTAEACRRYINRLDAGAVVPSSRIFYVPWEDWRGGMFDRSDMTGAPCNYTVKPNGQLRLYPTPDAPVTLQFTYQRTVQPLAADADVSIIPERHHAALVWRALMYYADTRDGTKEPYQKWERRRKQAMQRLYRDQLPEMSL